MNNNDVLVSEQKHAYILRYETIPALEEAIPQLEDALMYQGNRNMKHVRAVLEHALQGAQHSLKTSNDILDGYVKKYGDKFGTKEGWQ